MPTYQYACTRCRHSFEAVQSFTDDPLTECPQCTGRLRKVFNSVGIVFKGSGFYRNDSREQAVKSGEKSGEKSSDKTDAKADTKADTKSDTKSDSKPAAARDSGSGGGGKKSDSGPSTAGSAA